MSMSCASALSGNVFLSCSRTSGEWCKDLGVALGTKNVTKLVQAEIS
jgi:hypothetical protein